MTFVEAAAIMLGGNSSPVIQSITITENGHYEAPEGIDGYNPIDVKVPDRYDEGYKDGYKDAKDLNQKIIEQLNGDLPPVIDENGNTIENAIVSDNPEYTNDILKNIVFSNGGGSITVQNLAGDAKVTLVVSRVPHDVTGADCGVRVDLLTTNTLTGAKHMLYGGSVVNERYGKNFNARVDSFSFWDNMHRADFHFSIYDETTGIVIKSYIVGSISSVVDADKFGMSGSQTAITQTQG